MPSPTDIRPPFTETSARAKVQAAEDAWSSCDPDRAVPAYTEDSVWRNRDELLHGREEIRASLQRTWQRELDDRLRKDLSAFGDDRIAVRVEYGSRDAGGQWWRSYGNEMWEFSSEGLMRRRFASIGGLRIDGQERHPG
jgi:hypothetical protein